MAINPNPAFAIIDSINLDKVNYLRDGDSATPKEKDYAPFLVNKAMSQFIDSALYANEMNMRYHLTKQQQFDYLINTVRKAKKYGGKWAKVIESDDVDLVQKHYNVNKRRAVEYLKILTSDNLLAIRNSMITGGLDDVKPKRASK